MAPIKHPDWPDPPTDREGFYHDLQEFHRQRGTAMDPVPKVSTQHIDLFDLFHVIQSHGGYDDVSAKKLEWRRLAERHWSLGGNQNAAAYAFQLKSLFYRNLAAYAITRVYKQDPPPKEILELITAKGANLLNRTVDGYRKEQSARGKPIEPSDDSGSENDGTPRGDRIHLDDGGSGARTSRLRQAPPQRQFFQPDLSSTRQPRQLIQQMPSPQPIMQPNTYSSASLPASNIHSATFQINTWEGRNQSIGLHVRPIPTPSNNAAAFKEKVKRIHERKLAEMGRVPERRPPLLPATNYAGRNIAIRMYLSLRSGIPAEVDFAMHHLLKMSSNRGDSFRLYQYPGLSDGLIELGLKLASLFQDVEWTLSYREDQSGSDPAELDGLRGTVDLVDRIANLRILSDPGDMTSEDYRHDLEQGIDVALVLRNLSLLDENAHYLSKEPQMGDLLTIWLSLPQCESLIELHLYALEITEALARLWTMDRIPRALYEILIERLEEALEIGDRGSALIITRALTHIGTVRGEESLLDGITLNTLQRLLDWLLLDDEEAVEYILDFLYRFFSRPENTALFLEQCAEGKLNHEPYFQRIVRLMARDQYKCQEAISFKPAIEARPAMDILTIPSDLKAEIQDMAEPERAHKWLQSLFEEHPDSDIKQISLWQAYQSCWQGAPVTLLAASEFIKNVSVAFSAATAQVINGPTPKFIIKGIRCRHVPVTLEGKPYLSCQWTIRAPVPVDVASIPPPNGLGPDGMAMNEQQQQQQHMNGVPLMYGHPHRRIQRACGEFQRTPAKLWEHILTQHLGMIRDEDGKWDLAALRKQSAANEEPLFCKWGRCRRFRSDETPPDPFELGMHIKQHMPDTSPMAEQRAEHTKRKRPDEDEDDFDQPRGFPAEHEFMPYRNTPHVQYGGGSIPALIPHTCCLVLRMLARTVPKAVSVMNEQPRPGVPVRETHEWLQMLMGSIWDQIWELAAYDRGLAPWLIDIANMVEQGMEEEEEGMIDTV